MQDKKNKNYRLKEKLKSYKELKADRTKCDIDLEELEDEVLGVSGISLEERTSKTYKITSSVEQQAEILEKNKENIERKKRYIDREIRKIDNALTVLSPGEKEVIDIIYLQHKGAGVAGDRLNTSYSNVKKLEKSALRKMVEYAI